MLGVVEEAAEGAGDEQEGVHVDPTPLPRPRRATSTRDKRGMRENLVTWDHVDHIGPTSPYQPSDFYVDLEFGMQE